MTEVRACGTLCGCLPNTMSEHLCRAQETTSLDAARLLTGPYVRDLRRIL